MCVPLSYKVSNTNSANSRIESDKLCWCGSRRKDEEERGGGGGGKEGRYIRVLDRKKDSCERGTTIRNRWE